YNGIIYDGTDFKSLLKKITLLFDNPDLCRLLGNNAALTLNDIWSPKVAARNLYMLIKTLLTGNENPINHGPGSKD
ncbi:MAG: hypothetical protein K2H85_02705, partial [Allobaculum sp.]|nr:hypothetical protein [Allobaculum sp.]